MTEQDGERALRILLVEDDPNTRRVLVLLLGLRGWEVHEAEDGAEGLEKALTRSPDIVVSDLNLPRLSGIDLAKALRQDGLSVPIVAISSGPDRLIRQAEQSKLFATVMKKPIDSSAFAQALADLTQGSRRDR